MVSLNLLSDSSLVTHWVYLMSFDDDYGDDYDDDDDDDDDDDVL